MSWHGREVKDRTRAGAVEGLRLAADHLLAESRAIAPIDEGTLIRSGEASVDAPALKAAVSYNTVYAVRQHEELDWRHEPGRAAKYLQLPWIAERKVMLDLIAARIRANL